MTICGKSVGISGRGAVLALIAAAALLMSTTAPDAAEIKRIYPPYPDVWGRMLPFPNDDSYYISAEAYDMQDGNIQIYIAYRVRKVGEPLKFLWFDLFSESKREIDEETDRKFRRQNRGRRRLDFSLTLPDGSRIENMSERFGNCPETWDSHLVKREPGGRIVADKMLLSLYDRPVRVGLNPDCGLSGNRKSYFAHWRQIYPALALLKDSTILLYDSEGIFMLRVKPDWSSPFLAADGSLFLLDRKDVMKVVNEALRQRGRPPIQRVDDAIQRYLMKLKQETLP